MRNSVQIVGRKAKKEVIGQKIAGRVLQKEGNREGLKGSTQYPKRGREQRRVRQAKRRGWMEEGYHEY